jgi:hypothetical protein
MLCLVNKERTRRGLKPLGIDPKLTKCAQQHSDDQARRRKMSHNGSNGSSPSQRVKKSGYNYRSTGENVAYGQKSMEAVMKDWMNSPGHRRNILDPKFTSFGSGVAYSGSTPYYTQDFGSDGKPASNIPKCDGSDSDAAYGGAGGNDSGDDMGGDYGGGDDDQGGDYGSGSGRGGKQRGGRGGNNHGSGSGRGGGSNQGSGSGRGGSQRGGRGGGNDYGSGSGRGGSSRGGRGGKRGGKRGKRGRGGRGGGGDYGGGRGRDGGGRGRDGGGRGRDGGDY